MFDGGAKFIRTVAYSQICEEFEIIFEKSPVYEEINRFRSCFGFFDIFKELFYITKRHKIEKLFISLHPTNNREIPDLEFNFKKIVANGKAFIEYKKRKFDKFSKDIIKKWILLIHQKKEKLKANDQIEIENSIQSENVSKTEHNQEKRNSKNKKSKSYHILRRMQRKNSLINFVSSMIYQDPYVDPYYMMNIYGYNPYQMTTQSVQFDFDPYMYDNKTFSGTPITGFNSLTAPIHQNQYSLKIKSQNRSQFVNKQKRNTNF